VVRLINVVLPGSFVDYITPEEMADEERLASGKGISVAVLMENAGLGIAKEIADRFKPVRRKKVVVVAGLGNNGGDGMVAGRYLSSSGAAVTLFLLGESESIKTPESRLNWARLGGTGVETIEVRGAEEIELLERALRSADLVVDAIFGTGVRGEIRDPYAIAIRMINAARAKRVAVDIPSGLDPLTGETADTTVRADITLTLHRPKTGLRGKKEYTGELVVVPLGIE
jgi:NAD(P)H-hydrate epimerase